jgi:hypothetical protein
MKKDDQSEDALNDAPSPEDVEFVSLDPVPYLNALLAGLPPMEQCSDRDAALRRDLERGLQDRAFGLRLLVEDPRLNGVLPERVLTLEDVRQPTARERAQRQVLGRTVLIVERREWRARPVLEDGQCVAKPLTKPVLEDVLVPIIESRTYRSHCARREAMSLEDVQAELRRALAGERPLAICVAADVRYQPPHWLAFKGRVARQRQKGAKALIKKVERRFRSHAVGRAGRAIGSRNRLKALPVEHQQILKVVPQLRVLIKEAKRLCREGRDPGRAFDRVEQVLGPPPSSKQIHQHFVQAGPPRTLRAAPEEIVRWIVAKHLGMGLTAAKRLIKVTRQPKQG